LNCLQEKRPETIGIFGAMKYDIFRACLFYGFSIYYTDIIIMENEQ